MPLSIEINVLFEFVSFRVNDESKPIVNKSADFLLSELNTVFRVKLSIFMREQKCVVFFCHPSFQRFIHCDFLNRQKKFKVTHGG